MYNFSIMIDKVESTPIRPVSEDDWPYEYVFSDMAQKEIAADAKYWCEQRQLADVHFQWAYYDTKVHTIHWDSLLKHGFASSEIEEFKKALQHRSSKAFYFYFKDPRDLMLFKLSFS